MDQRTLDFLRETPTFLIAGHQGPDGDCVGSMVGFYQLITALGRGATIILEKPLSPEFHFLVGDIPFKVYGKESLPPAQALVLLDCNHPSRTGGLEKAITAWSGDVLVLDHHAHSGSFPVDGEYLARIDDSAAATAVLVLELYEELGLTPDPQAAQALMAGILTDTYWFQNTNTDSRALDALSRISNNYAPPRNTAELYDLLCRQYPLGVHEMLSVALQRLERHSDGRLLLTWLEACDIDAAGLDDLETEYIMRPLLSVAGNDVVAVIYERHPGEMKYSIRSRGGGYALALARELGGGGHNEAAGASFGGSAQEAIERLLAVWKRIS